MFSCKSAGKEAGEKGKKLIFLLVATNFPTLHGKTTTDLMWSTFQYLQIFNFAKIL